MQVVKIVYWQEVDAMWLGYLEQHPDYMTQGYTLEELKKIYATFIKTFMPA